MEQEITKRNFSLVELLIVIVIILILGTISVIALNDQRAKARDAKRISDIRQIRTALEFYNDSEGSYPAADKQITLGSGNYSKLCSKAEGGFVSAGTACADETTYMAKIPADPLTGRQYIYLGDAKGYDLIFQTEKDSVLGAGGIYHAHSEAINAEAGNK